MSVEQWLWTAWQYTAPALAILTLYCHHCLRAQEDICAE